LQLDFVDNASIEKAIKTVIEKR